MKEQFSKIQKKFTHDLAEQIMAALEWRKINSFFASTRAAALTRVMELIPSGSSVCQGGSVTLDQCGIRQALQQRNDIRFIDPYDPNIDRDKQIQNRREGLLADVFVTGSNAITRNGIIVNRDGLGNRVAAISFGPKRVILVIGMNKIVPDIDCALTRIDQVAAPMNCERLNRDTPCRETLRCHDCASEDRICSVTTIVERQTDPDRLHVILVPEKLGF